MGRSNTDDPADVGAAVHATRLVNPGHGTMLLADATGAAGAALVSTPGAGLAQKRERARLHVSWLRILCIATLLLVTIEFIHPVGVAAPGLRALNETLVTLIAVGAAGLAALQFVHTRRLDRLLVLGALVLLALNEFVRGVVPAGLGAHFEIGAHYGAGFTAGSPLAGLFLAASLAAAAFTPPDRLIVGDPRRPLLIALVSAVAAFGLAELFGLLLREPLMAAPHYAGPGLHRALDHPLALVVLLASVAFLAHAAFDFVRWGRAEQSRSPMLLAAAAIVLAAEQLYYLGLPRISPRLFTGQDGLTLLGTILLLSAALAKELEIRAAVTRSAALAERRRVAEDLHDGLAQDLAFIAAHEVRLAEDLGDAHPVAMAAKHALALSRDTINGLCDMSSTPPIDALRAIAHELGGRFGVAIAVDAQPDASLAPDAREHLARIAREAIANAVRHGHARNVVLSLRRTDGGITLRVSDDGCGIHADGPRATGGFGLRSMHERATALGGDLKVRDRKAGGTELEVVLP